MSKPKFIVEVEVGFNCDVFLSNSRNARKHLIECCGDFCVVRLNNDSRKMVSMASDYGDCILFGAAK